MPPPGRTDQVYQLTLTELAFVVIFLILLLSGWMIVKTDDEKAAALREKAEALAQLAVSDLGDGASESAQQRQALARTAQEIARKLADPGMADPDAIVSALTRKAAAETENQSLRKRIDDLDAQLTALEEIKKSVAASAGGMAEPEAAGEAGRNAAQRTILSAVAFKRLLEQETRDSVAAGQEQAKALEYANAWQSARAGAEGTERLVKENRDLRAQAAWMRSQLDSHGGRDYPPCWAEESTGKPQYLLTVSLHDSGIAVAPAWPPERNAEAEKLPGLVSLTGAGILSIQAFKSRLEDLDADSKAKQCRHYVRLVNRVGNLATFNRQRYAVEEFFYKFEVR